MNIGGLNIHGLFYADDIVLIAANDQDLTDMLNVAHMFGTKWGLKFNEKKSQVLIIGKRISNKTWVISLGDMNISETKTYKYLGIIINRQLTDTEQSYKATSCKKG